MTNAESVKKYQAKLAEFKIRTQKEEGEGIRQAADRLGMSVQMLFLESVREYINNHSSAAQPTGEQAKAENE